MTSHSTHTTKVSNMTTESTKMTPNTRSYIKQYGRVAHRNQTPQLEQITHDGNVIGEVSIIWECDWVFKTKVFSKDGSFQINLQRYDDAVKWIWTRTLEVNRHRSFGAYLTYFLSEVSMSKTSLGVNLNVSRQTIHQWINDESLPNTPTYLKFSRLVAKWTRCDYPTTLVDISDSIH